MQKDRAAEEASEALAESVRALAAKQDELDDRQDELDDKQEELATCVQERQGYQFNLTRTRNGANLLREQIDELNQRLEKQQGVIDALKKQLEEANKK